MASAGEMTPPTGGRAASWERAAGASKIAMTTIAMTMSVLMRLDRDISTPANYATLAFPAERGESVRAKPTSAAARENAQRKHQAPSFSRCGRHPRHAASGTKTARDVCFRAIVMRSRRWFPVLSFRSKPAKPRKEKRKKEGGTPTDA